MPEPDRLTPLEQTRHCIESLRSELLAQRCEDGYWIGELSASALSTATAISALSVVVKQTIAPDKGLIDLIKRGCRYLDLQQNDDGGYGDTDRSYSNIATSYLVLAARTLAETVVGPEIAGSDGKGMQSLRQYIVGEGEVEGLRKRYGTDKTFVVPIMTNLAIAGLMDWKQVARLPFEAAVFPGKFYRFMSMPVVSYAIPALVAIGQVQHFLGPKAWLPIRQIRAASVARTTRVLRSMQPDSGGYLEATPLTSFVLMSLAACAKSKRDQGVDHRDADEVIDRCVQFLTSSIRQDGSWPIDTNLATWITSLSIHALGRWSGDDRTWATDRLIKWHLQCQHKVQHPFTGASPGGWGWTDLSGAVPDGDDTPAAILAAIRYRRVLEQPARENLDVAVANGLQWLADLQNRDGGLPTFCRGWGKLPFDRSSTDLTAHFTRAIESVGVADDLAGNRFEAGQGIDHVGGLTKELRQRLRLCRDRGCEFLRRTQRKDGSWLPLWFGNQDNPDDINPIYGTSRVLMAIASLESMRQAASQAADFLIEHQNEDDGWGGGKSVAKFRVKTDSSCSDATPYERLQSSFEETCVAVEALSEYLRNLKNDPLVNDAGRVQRCEQAIIDAVLWLTEAVRSGRHKHAWPIGFYFAKLWYYEKLYPLVFATAALSAAADALNSRPSLIVEASN